MSRSINIVLLNIRGLHDHMKRRKAFARFNDMNCDIICLQETYCNKELMNNFNNSRKGKVYYSLTNSAHRRGVAIFLKENLEIIYLNHHSSNDGRIVSVNVEFGDLHQVYSIVSVYASNIEKQRKEFVQKLQ